MPFTNFKKKVLKQKQAILLLPLYLGMLSRLQINKMPSSRVTRMLT